MGRKKKFGEESDFVSVRVPKSRRKEYRIAIKEFVEKKFTNESSPLEDLSKVKISKKISDGFRKFEEFIEEIKQEDSKKKN